MEILSQRVSRLPLIARAFGFIASWVSGKPALCKRAYISSNLIDALEGLVPENKVRLSFGR